MPSSVPRNTLATLWAREPGLCQMCPGRQISNWAHEYAASLSLDAALPSGAGNYCLLTLSTVPWPPEVML